MLGFFVSYVFVYASEGVHSAVHLNLPTPRLFLDGCQVQRASASSGRGWWSAFAPLSSGWARSLLVVHSGPNHPGSSCSNTRICLNQSHAVVADGNDLGRFGVIIILAAVGVVRHVGRGCLGKLCLGR